MATAAPAYFPYPHRTMAAVMEVERRIAAHQKGLLRAQKARYRAKKRAAR